MRWLNYFKNPNFEITITVFQALMLLVEKYKGDRSNAKKYEAIKTLCLSGVRGPKDDLLLEDLLNDSVLSRYRISSRKKDINADPVRRYFESHLCHKTLETSLDLLDRPLLERHLDSIVNRLDVEDQYDALDTIYTRYPAYAMDKYSEGMFALNRNNSFQSLRPDSPTGIASSDQILDDRKQKMRLLAGCMYAAKKESDTSGVQGQLSELRYQKNGIYDPKNRERERKRDSADDRTQCVFSDRMGIMSSFMPLPLDDDLLAETLSQYTRSVDKFSYSEGKVQSSVFSNQVSPFVGSISGTILIKLSMMAQLLREGMFVYQSEPVQLKLFLQSHIAYMLHQAGGHSLDEYVRVLQLPKVQNEFKTLPEFSSITVDSLFKTGNETAFDAAIEQTIAYNHRILNTKKMQAELEEQKRQKTHPGVLGTVTLFSRKEKLQYTVVNTSILGYIPLFVLINFLDEKRLSVEKDASVLRFFMQFFGVVSAFVVAASMGDEVIEEHTSLAV